MAFKTEGCVVVMLAVVVLAMGLTHSEAAITCSIVSTKLSRCVGYLKTGSPSPSMSGCCAGVTALNALASTPADRKAACKCIKQQSITVKPLPQYVSALPLICGVKLGYAISPSTNCDAVH